MTEHQPGEGNIIEPGSFSEETQDALAQLKAGQQQAVAASKDVAAVVYAYYYNLVEAGFEKEQAFELVQLYQAQLFGMGQDQGGDGE